MITNINKDMVYKYLGYDKNKHILTKEIASIIDESIQEVLNNSKQKVVCSAPIDIVRKDKKIYLSDILLDGNDIYEHLDNCDKLVIMSATLGANIDKLIRKYELVNMAKAVVIDTVANVLIEQVCDEFEDNLRAETLKNDEYLTIRFSPGYGDLPIEIQKDLLLITDSERRIGLTVTDSQIMVPRKSVTAIMGISKLNVKGKRATCKNCKLKSKCIFLQRGTTCE